MRAKRLSQFRAFPCDEPERLATNQDELRQQAAQTIIRRLARLCAEPVALTVA